MTVTQAPLFGVEQAERTSDDVYTPAWIFEQLGLTFDLDVASPPGGIPWIPAERFYTQADDGLAQPWHGCVWMNPPYSQPAAWVDRFIQHGNGIALLQVSKSKATHKIFECANGIHFPVPFKFANDHAIYMPVLFAAMGDDNVKALQRLGRVR